MYLTADIARDKNVGADFYFDVKNVLLCKKSPSGLSMVCTVVLVWVRLAC